MVCKLEIKNYAIIDFLAIEFSEGLNIITGETGSGKSILLGALGLILGKRVDSKVLLRGDKKCVIEGSFDIGQYRLESFFSGSDLDYADPVIIRREINPEGKSRAFINDTPVTLKTLQELTIQLVDLHEQFENLGINDTKHQIKMLDAFAQAIDTRTEYEKLYRKFKRAQDQLIVLRQKQNQAIKQRDYLQFQLDELLDQQIDPEKDTLLEQKLNELDHAEEITAVMGSLTYALEEGDPSILTLIKELQTNLNGIGRYHVAVREISERLHQVYIELEDIGYETKKVSEDIELNPEEANILRLRLDKLNTLLHKHQVTDIDQLSVIQERIDAELQGYINLDDEIDELSNQVKQTRQELTKIAQALTDKRRKALPEFQKKVNELLHELKMEHAAFKISHSKSDQLLANGQDDLHFLFAPNKGSDFFEIKKVASGGEMSRLALIVKSLVAGSIDMPTLVFDEIDSGVSGDVAKKMGEILKRLSTKHQVISITHSPQVAARASKHFTVFKETTATDTKTRINELDREGRLLEIATMLSSSPPSKAAITSAAELMAG
ncbi:MAG: DNA repair protein RecN [Saprospiraceae bacterium]|nr:DNA repair protein RecN [Saprospiraceae bacterium]